MSKYVRISGNEIQALKEIYSLQGSATKCNYNNLTFYVNDRLVVFIKKSHYLPGWW